MAAVTSSEMRAVEAHAITEGWTEEKLLDLAGSCLGRAIGRFFPYPGTAVAFLGKGHNAGDALVALRILRDRYGWQVSTRSTYPIEECAPLVRKKWSELGLAEAFSGPDFDRETQRPLILLDGLLGIGARGDLRSPLREAAEEMEWLRNHTGAKVAAVDLPSGLDADSGVPHPGAVVADVTFTVGNPKVGLLRAPAVNHTGPIVLVKVAPISRCGDCGMEMICPQELDHGKKPRPFDFHKGMAGSVGVIAGSRDFPGAAVLAATGALRGGAGLVTLVVPEASSGTIASKCPPEIIVQGYRSATEVLDFHQHDALVVGCGLGQPDRDVSGALLDLFRDSPLPTVIDADGLNLIARSARTDLLRPNHVITPHPGEFRRLAPDLARLPREVAAREFANRHPSTLLLKGSRTLITRIGGALWCNSTGSPAMASGGQGDLLAGVIGARLAIGDSPLEAACLSAWLCGRAAELALATDGHSDESLTASDVAARLGAAFTDWKNATR